MEHKGLTQSIEGVLTRMDREGEQPPIKGQSAQELTTILKQAVDGFVATMSRGGNFELKEVEELLVRLEELFAEVPNENKQKQRLIRTLEGLATDPHVKNRIYWLSFLAKMTNQQKYVEQILTYCLEDETLDIFEINYIRWQCSYLIFTNYSMGNRQTLVMSRQVYRNMFLAFYEYFEKECQLIPKEDRNNKLVIVTTSQFLLLNHGPTKTTLDRCFSLITAMNFNVILINTIELVSQAGQVPFYAPVCPNLLSEHAKETFIEYRGVTIPYFQCHEMMPNTTEMSGILKFVRDMRPYFMVNIGGNSLLSDLCSKITPVLTVSTVPSSLPTTESQFSILGRQINKQELDFLQLFGMDERNVIEGTFTSSFKLQSHQYTREELKLPQDKFLIAIIGGRLDLEVKDDFVQMLLETVDGNTHFVFIGGFLKKYDGFAEKYPVFKENSTLMGFQDDVLAILEVCDLYVNPKRVGGGTSCVEAMFKGVPVVTIDMGDVGLNVGEAFHVESYDDMILQIKKYREDTEFYKAQSQKAKERAAKLTDTDGLFREIIEKALQSELFV